MRKGLLTRATLLGLLTTLGGCATSTLGTGPGTQTGSGSSATCLALHPITPSRGKPGGPTIEELAAVLDRDHPVERSRNFLGDTDATLRQVDQNNAALIALCGGANGGLPR